MGHVIDFNLARLKRCLPLPDQSKIREARMASLAARLDTVRPMRNGFLKPISQNCGASGTHPSGQEL